jgi:flavin-dependent dehydrogenase
MKRNKKVAIVGAGIVGLYLGKRLKEKGWEVVIFERKKEIGKKSCTGLISKRIFQFIPEASKIAKREIRYLIAHFPKKDVKIEFSPSLFLFDREELDNLVAEIVQKKGVRIELGEEIKEIPKGFFRVIGCDGALSTVRKLLNLPSPAQRLGIQYFQKEKNEDLDIEIWPQKEIAGFLWKIPEKEKTEYGILGLPKVSFKFFKEFLEEKGIEMKKENIKSALVPCGIVLPNKENVTLCGDAAGLTTPSSGGGVIWGLKAAELLVEEFPNFLSYRKKAYKFFWWRIQKTKVIMRIIYQLSNTSLTTFFPRKVEIDTNLFYSYLRYKINF